MTRLTNSKATAKNLRATLSRQRLGKDFRIKRAGHCPACGKLIFAVVDYGQSLEQSIRDKQGYVCDNCHATHSADVVYDLLVEAGA